MKKRILILSDSLALPREYPEKCEWKQTYPILLSNSFIVHTVAIGGATSTTLRQQLHYHASFKPEIVIIHVGIVDCSPRFATKTELSLIRRIPILSKFLIRSLNKPKIRKLRKITYVSPGLFELNLKKIKCYLDERQIGVFFIGIAPASQKYETQLPGITERIHQYNNISKKVFGASFIDNDFIKFKDIMSDNHHLNQEGHKKIAKLIYNRIVGINKQ